MKKIVVLTVAFLLMFTSVAIATDRFPDVSEGLIHHDAITWANDNGVVEGFEDGTFRWDEPIKRGQAASMFHRYEGSMREFVTQAFALHEENHETGTVGPQGPQGEPGPEGPAGEDGLGFDVATWAVHGNLHAEAENEFGVHFDGPLVDSPDFADPQGVEANATVTLLVGVSGDYPELLTLTRGENGIQFLIYNYTVEGAIRRFNETEPHRLVVRQVGTTDERQQIANLEDARVVEITGVVDADGNPVEAGTGVDLVHQDHEE